MQFFDFGTTRIDMSEALTVTSIYAATTALAYAGLSARVIILRRAGRVSLGDGGDEKLARAIRVHGNFSEYVPLTLLLMALAELQAHDAWRLNVLGAILIVGRVFHVLGVSTASSPGRYRVLAMVFTFGALIDGALMNLGMLGSIT